MAARRLTCVIQGIVAYQHPPPMNSFLHRLTTGLDSMARRCGALLAVFLLPLATLVYPTAVHAANWDADTLTVLQNLQGDTTLLTEAEVKSGKAIFNRSCHGSGGMESLQGQLPVPVRKRGLMDQKVCPTGQVHSRVTKHRVGGIHQTHPCLGRAAKAGACNGAATHGNGFTFLEATVERAWGNAQCLGFFHVEPPRPRLLRNAKPTGRDAVPERARLYNQIVVLKENMTLRGRGVGMKVQRIAQAGRGEPQG